MDKRGRAKGVVLMFRYTGVFKRVWVGRSGIEKSVCIDVLLLPYYDSINAATNLSS